jgi:hypothetical protein
VLLEPQGFSLLGLEIGVNIFVCLQHRADIDCHVLQVRLSFEGLTGLVGVLVDSRHFELPCVDGDLQGGLVGASVTG